jgi:hypothetical protein
VGPEAPERLELLDEEFEELGELLDCGFAADLLVGADVVLDAVGADEPGAKAEELDGADSPGALERVAPPLATARAAAASAALVLGRAGEELLAGAGLELDEEGDGATGRVASARLEVGVDRVSADVDGVDDAERPEFDPELLLELDEPEPDDPEPDELEPDGVLGLDGDEEGVDFVGAEDDTGGRVKEGGLFDDVDDEFELDDEEDGDGAADRLGRELPDPEEVGGEAGRVGGVKGVGVLEICGAVLVAGSGLLAGAFSGAGASGVGEPSEREDVGRTRGVVSSALSSLELLDVTLGDASVVIGTVPPPGIRRDVLSGRWLLSELTSHLHAQAADEEPVVGFRYLPLRIRQQGPQDPPVWPILA